MRSDHGSPTITIPQASIQWISWRSVVSRPECRPVPVVKAAPGRPTRRRSSHRSPWSSSHCLNEPVMPLQFGEIPGPTRQRPVNRPGRPDRWSSVLGPPSRSLPLLRSRHAPSPLSNGPLGRKEQELSSSRIVRHPTGRSSPWCSHSWGTLSCICSRPSEYRRCRN